MRALFLLAVAVGALVLFGRRRRFDFFAIGYLSACAYYLPCFFGFTLDVNLTGPTGLVSRVLQPEVHALAAALLLAVSLGALAHDRRRARTPGCLDRDVRGGLAMAAACATGLALLGLAGTVLGAGRSLLDPDKAEVMAVLDRWYPIWTSGAIVGLVLGVATRRRVAAGICALLLLFDVYVGFRSNAAMAGMGLFVLLLGERPRRLLSREGVRPILLGLLVALSFFAYKGFYIGIKRGAWDLVRQRALDPEYLAEVVLYSSEPFLITGNLNEVVRTGFTTEPGRYLQLANAMVPFAPELGAEVHGFNEYFQPALFPTREGGLASSFLAEAWSAGGWLASACMILVYVLGLDLGSRLLTARSTLTRACAAILFPAWAFYLHRNDLLYQLVIERRLAAALVFSVLASALVFEAVRAGVPAPVTGLSGARGREP